jgi:hypothetical protein
MTAATGQLSQPLLWSWASSAQQSNNSACKCSIAECTCMQCADAANTSRRSARLLSDGRKLPPFTRTYVVIVIAHREQSPAPCSSACPTNRRCMPNKRAVHAQQTGGACPTNGRCMPNKQAVHAQRTGPTNGAFGTAAMSCCALIGVRRAGVVAHMARKGAHTAARWRT